MAKEKSIAASSIIGELFQIGAHKRNQGRTVRLVTSVTFGVVFALAAWRLNETLSAATLSENPLVNRLIRVSPGVLLLAGWWFSYRVVNWPRFADFLIAVEAEMSKVSWPTQTELFRSSLVVIFLIFSMAALLFGFDMFWQFTFQFFGILN
jgi:preprotein translocase subunit SecE